MDAFDFVDEPKSRRRRRRRGQFDFIGLIWNVASLYILLMTLALAGIFLAIFINPYSAINPFPPPTLIPTLPPLDTPTGPSPTAGLPGGTATSTPEPGGPTATSQLLPTATDFAFLTPSATQPGPTSGPQFVIQTGNPTYLAHPSGCGILAVGGQVFNMEGAPIIFQPLRLNGTLGGQAVGPKDGLTGSASHLGTGGYEIRIADQPANSTASLFIQVFSQEGLPLSDLIVFDTFADCTKNLVLINFVQVR